MHKFITLLIIIFFLFSCSGNYELDSVEEIQKTISKYFKAMKKQDYETLYALTPEPKIIPYKSFAIMSISNPKTKDEIVGYTSVKTDYKIRPLIKIDDEAPLFDYLRDLNSMKEDQYELTSILGELTIKAKDLPSIIEKTKDKKKRIALEGKLAEVQKSKFEKEKDLRETSSKFLELKKRIDIEMKLIKLSTGKTEKIEKDEYLIRLRKTAVVISLTLYNGDKKELELSLRRYILYILDNSLPQKLGEKVFLNFVEGKWVIERESIPDDVKFVNLETKDSSNSGMDQGIEGGSRGGAIDDVNVIKGDGEAPIRVTASMRVPEGYNQMLCMA